MGGGSRTRRSSKGDAGGAGGDAAAATRQPRQAGGVGDRSSGSAQGSSRKPGARKGQRDSDRGGGGGGERDMAPPPTSTVAASHATPKRSPWLSPVRAASRLLSAVKRTGSATRLRSADIKSPADYSVIRTIGKGSFGEVLLVEAKSNKQKYAVKIIHLDTMQDPNMLEQIRQERAVLDAARGHPHIVCMLSSWMSEQCLYLVLEYIRGRDLFDTIRSRKRLPSPQAARYVLQMAMALEFLHQKQIVFRDLKLENVLVNHSSDSILLTDFGLAKFLPSSGRTSTICGTIQYMAPELLREEAYGTPVDWWCLGVVSYILVCGRYPFSAGIDALRYDHSAHDRMIMARRIDECDLPFPSFVDCAAEVVIRKLMDPAPADRISSYSHLEPMRWFDGVSVAPIHTDQTQVSSEPPSPVEKKKPNGLEGFSGSYLEYLIANTAHNGDGDGDGDGGGGEATTSAETHGTTTTNSTDEHQQQQLQQQQKDTQSANTATPTSDKTEDIDVDDDDDDDEEDNEELRAHFASAQLSHNSKHEAVHARSAAAADDDDDDDDGRSTGQLSSTVTTGRVSPVVQRQRRSDAIVVEGKPEDGKQSAGKDEQQQHSEQQQQHIEQPQQHSEQQRSQQKPQKQGDDGDADDDEDLFAMLQRFKSHQKMATPAIIAHEDSARSGSTNTTAENDAHNGSHRADDGDDGDDVDDQNEGAVVERTPSARDALFDVIVEYQKRQYNDQRSNSDDSIIVASIMVNDKCTNAKGSRDGRHANGNGTPKHENGSQRDGHSHDGVSTSAPAPPAPPTPPHGLDCDGGVDGHDDDAWSSVSDLL
ncbi:AGC/PKC/IOTA protein kinase [Salpingoeca rosetta]|uniref:AGC/PKC/IOTA protein kinase n=1 Tax=Salpingoeca rosetta (strain ATCC 50818 / BSB-021) TaxID=946362 RepID=F2US81_SALR5|nr:AGC/PKC/IOTA protein kinase [Salpingoeca rosetta]EGD80486.1 AGC/PKC/IOTA protein kinase [Salpingoeca rosetta]|eukprot:XP_004988050.1 AGC/PKC/IOTA protein kinase [Salpingoeca rosetta]